MTERDEIVLTRGTLRIAVLGFLLVILSIGYITISSCQLQVEKPAALPSYIPAHLISNLQFSSSGKLIATVESGPFSGNGPFVDVYTWDSAYRPAKAKVTLDFGQLTGKPALPKLIPMFTTAAPIGKQPSFAQVATGLPYALSEDGSMVAWSWEGRLFAGPLNDPKRFPIPLNPPTPVVALSFFGADLVGVVHSGGEFRLERLSARDPNLPGTKLFGAWRISGRGPFRVLSNFQKGDGMLVPGFQMFPVSTAGSFITVSKKGKPAMGTTDGIILFPRPSEQPRLVLLPEMKRVQTLAFRDEQNLIASIDRGSLFLVEDETRAIRLTSAPRGVRLLAVSHSRIAMVTSRAIVAADLKERPVLDEGDKLWVAVTFYLLSLIALFRLMFADWYRLSALKRALASHAPAPCHSEESGMKEGNSGPDQLDTSEEGRPNPEG